MSHGDMCGCGAQESPNHVVLYNNGYGPTVSGGGTSMGMWGACPPLETPYHEEPRPMLECNRPTSSK
jgi:hypothetical protein